MTGLARTARAWLSTIVILQLVATSVHGYAGINDGMSCNVGSAGLDTMHALMGIYNKLNGKNWTFHHLTEVIGHAETGTLRWGSCSTCTVPHTTISSGRHGTISLQALTLPAYCCWRGVSCCSEPLGSPSNTGFSVSNTLHAEPTRDACKRHSVTALQLWGLQLSGAFHSIMPELQVLHSHGLKHLDFSKNNLTGQLPDNIGSLSNLTHLLLGSNNISGAVPASLQEMRQLMQLDLEINKLTGSLDQGQLCPDDNSLKLLLIRGNNFSGPLDLRKCTQLQMADVQGNRFTGSLPVDGRNRALSVLRADHNSFNGTIPLGLWDLPSLMSLELTNNSLSGTLPKAIAAANYLTQLRLGNNKLAGTVPLAINTLSHLAELDLSDNVGLTGTLPKMNWMLGLQTLSVRNTLVRGTIPQELADLPYLENVDVRDTHMTCCASLEEAQQRRMNDTLLPSYLTLDQAPINTTSSVEEEYITAAGNMKCGMVKRAPQSSMVAQGWVSKPVNVSRQTWMVGPEYTWYMRCSCIKGYEPGPFAVISTPSRCNRNSSFSSSAGTTADGNTTASDSVAESLPDPACSLAVTAVMTCSAVSSPKFNSGLVAGIVSAGAVLLLLMLLVYLSFKRLGRMKRQLEWWRKHLAGMPRCGEMSIVTTDIEGYSGMFKRAPEQMYRALTLHNNVIRHAKYVNCGSIIQQEGDSFTLAFHTAFDAVAFCLQVQLGLMEVPWPKGVADGGSSDSSNDGSNGSNDGSGADKAQQQPGSSGCGSPPSRRKLSQRFEGVSSILLSPASASKLRKSRLATGSPTPPPPAFEALAAADTAAAAVGGGQSPTGSPKQALPAAAAAAAAAAATASGSNRGSSGSFLLCQPGNGIYAGGSNAAASPTKQLADNSRGSSRTPAALLAPCAAAAGHSDGEHSPVSATAAAAFRQAGAQSSTSCFSSHAAAPLTTTATNSTYSSSSRFLSSFAVSSAANGLFRVGGSSSWGSKHTAAAAADGSNGAGAGSSDGSDGCGSSGLFSGLRVRMGVVTGQVHWEPCGAGPGSNAAAANSLAAIINSSLYKLSLDVSDAGNGGQVLLDAATFSKIKEELAPLGVVDANGIDYAQLEAARPFSLWQALRGGRRDRKGGAGRTRAASDEAVVLDMGLWQKQQLPPTTPTSPAPTSAAMVALRTSLPGAMPPPNLFGRDHPHYSLPNSPNSSANGGYGGYGGSHDGGWGAAAAGGCGMAAAGGWGFWGSGAATSTTAGGGYGGAHSCATAGSGSSEHGSARLRLYQVLSPGLVDRAAVWGDALALRGSWVCLDAPYFEAPGAMFYTMFSNTSCSYTAGSRSSSMSKVSDIRHWQLKMQQHLQQQQQQQHAGGSTHGLDSFCRASSGIPAVHSLQQQQQQQQQQRGMHQQLTISACQVDTQLPSLMDRQAAAAAVQGHSTLPSPLQYFRSGSSPAAAAAAAAMVAAVPPLLLPAVTLMFVSVDGSKVLRKQAVRDVHCQLSQMFMEALRHVPGSYMCRMQAGDLKYMVAFASAPAALQWALMVQEAAMYLDYPPSFERMPQLRSEYDSRGQLVFRGPRLRIGLCEGVPRTVMPDHLGRADYYGASVNMAARYMDAAAHGGQIACELELALSVMQHWAATASLAANGSSSCDHSSSSGNRDSSSNRDSLFGCGSNAAAAAAATRVVDSSSSPSTPISLLQQGEGGSTGSFSSSHVESPYSFAPGSAAAAAAAVLGQQRQLLHTTSDASSSSCMVVLPQLLQQHQQQQQQQVKDTSVQQQQQQQPEQPLFGLSEVPTISTSVEVEYLGAFRFKGGAYQQLQMANVTLSSLTGRARFIPSEPPKGKGERVAGPPNKGAGPFAAQGQVPLPALVQQYRSRVPDHLLECRIEVEGAAAGAAAGARDCADTDCEAVRSGSLRVGSAPQQQCGLMQLRGVRQSKQSSGGDVWGKQGSREGEDEGLEAEVVEVLGLRQKSHSFTCPPRTPGVM